MKNTVPLLPPFEPSVLHPPILSLPPPFETKPFKILELKKINRSTQRVSLYFQSSSPSIANSMSLPPPPRSLVPFMKRRVQFRFVRWMHDAYFSYYASSKQGKSFNPDCQGGYCRDTVTSRYLRALHLRKKEKKRE